MESDKYYLNIAKSLALKSLCKRRRYGAVIVKNDTVVSMGSNNSPVGTKSCSELGFCTRMKFNIPRGTRYELCRSIHAEAQAIINANPSDLVDSILYLVGLESDGSLVEYSEPCILCKKLIINAQIKEVRVLINDKVKIIKVNDWVVNDRTMDCIDSYVESK